MKIYAAGWALQSPVLNLFKRFLRLNPAVEVSGVIYPRKIPIAIDSIPVLDFHDARQIIKPGDIVLKSHRPAVSNDGLTSAFIDFFNELGVETTNVSKFVSTLIAHDHENVLNLPIVGVTSADVRYLQSANPLSLADDLFADLESSDSAQRLDAIARESNWDAMLEFDRDKTPENTLFQTIFDLYRLGYVKSFRVLDAPLVFLNALLRMKALRPEDVFSVELGTSVVKELGSRLEFFQRTLRAVEGEKQENAVLLAGSAKPVLEAFQNSGKAIPAIFFMRRSIFDYRNITPLLDRKRHRVLLRQVDTSPSNLIAAVLE